MVHKRRVLILSTLYLWEVLLTIASFFMSYGLRKYLPFKASFPDTIQPYLPLLPFIVVIWLFLFWFHGLYRDIRSSTTLTDVGKVVKVVVSGMVLLLAGILIFREFWVSRALLGFFGFINFMILTANRLFLRSVIRHYVKRGYDRIYVLVAGTGKIARQLVQTMMKQKEWGVEVIGYVSEQGPLQVTDIEGLPVLGTCQDIPHLVKDRVVDEVVFAVSRRSLDDLDGVIATCDEVGVRVRIAMDYFKNMNSQLYMEQMSGIPLLTFSPVPKSEFRLLVKRILDIGVSVLGLILTSPVFLLATLAIKLTSPGPVIFRQRRAGKNGRVFTLYKFRTMRQDAERMKETLSAMNEMDGPVFKIKNDPRVTSVGRVLRKLSLDELPQLWNVLRGDMSIVGPRPPIPSEVEQYQRWQRRRLSMRPGITCIWQIRGRNRIEFKRWMEMDLEYIDNWSLMLDFSILVKTIPAVLIGKGAS